MHVIEPFPRYFSASLTQDMIYQSWQEKTIGWGQLFKGRLSSKWGQAQEIYYRENSETRETQYFSGKIWASKVIGKLIKISL